MSETTTASRETLGFQTEVKQPVRGSFGSNTAHCVPSSSERRSMMNRRRTFT